MTDFAKYVPALFGALALTSIFGYFFVGAGLLGRDLGTIIAEVIKRGHD